MHDFIATPIAHKFDFVRNLRLVAVGVVAVSGLMNPPQSLAQSQASAAPSFEVASIRPHVTPVTVVAFLFRDRKLPSRLTV